jgi:hypothetical protein
MLLCKCNGICATLYIGSSRLSLNVMSTKYVIMKKPHDELFICCMKFTYLYNKCLTLTILVNNCMMPFGYFFIIGAFESYIVQCIFGLEACIFINIQWLLLWIHVEDNCLGIYVRFLWLHMCVVGNLVIIIFDHIIYSLRVPNVGCLTIH